jgi:prepilin-type processing-associated H-X9-DG protein
MYAFANDKFDNRLSWPSQDLSFKLDGKFMKDHIDYYAEKSRKHGIRESRLGIYPDRTKWWLNGHLLCNTIDEWSTRGLNDIYKNLQKIITKDCVLFVNRRDFPIHHKHNSSFVDAFGLQPEMPMFHKRPLCQILSFYGSDDYHDLLWPPIEHWNIQVPFVEKTILKAVFRGSLTGRSFDDTNPRLFLSRLRDPNINAGLTAWTPRDRIINGVIHYYGPSVFLSQPLSIEEQCKYAIILYVDGHVSSSRLLWNLLSGSLVIHVATHCEAPLQWLHKIKVPEQFQEGIHYVKCLKEDVSKTVAKYLSETSERKKIASSGRSWAIKAIDQMILYCRELLNNN